MRRTIQDGSGETDWTAIGKSLKDSGVEDDLFNNGQSTRPLCTSEVRLFTVVEVAKLLGIGRSKVYELLYSGELKSVKIGGSRRVRYTDLGDYVRYLEDAS